MLLGTHNHPGETAGAWQKILHRSLPGCRLDKGFLAVGMGVVQTCLKEVFLGLDKPL